MAQPNILFIQVDQLAARALKAYGNTICHSPNLDRLAEEGAVFETAYCNFALCAPSRFSMATGQLCSAIGAYDNAAEMPASVPTYAHHLRRLGYQTALSGKMHFIGPDQHHGFETRLTPDLYPADFSWAPNWGDEGERDTNDPSSVLTSGICERSVQIDFDEMVTHRAVQHLYDIARSSDDRPFFLQVSYTHPHEPYLCRQEYWDLYEDREVTMPRVGPMSAADHDPHSVRLLSDFGMLDYDFDDADIYRSRRAYFGSISYIDDLVGRLLDTLKATGADENTAILFTSDHGDMLGERGMWFKKHFFESSLRVPLFLTAPWIKPQRIAEFASLVDVLPTLIGIASESATEAPEETFEGADLAAFLDRGNTVPERVVYAEYLAEATTAPIFMIRRGKYKYVSSTADPALLFDMEADSDELRNLAAEPDYAETVDSFEAEVQSKWDSATLAEAIVISQKRRRFIIDAHKHGAEVRWNHGESAGQSVPWYRGEEGYNEWAFNYLPPSNP